MKEKNTKSQIRLPLLLAIAIATGVLIGANVIGSSDNTGNRTGVATGSFKFKEVLNYVSKNYVDEVDEDALVEGAINSMLETLDPHSVYISAEDQEYSNSQLQGNFDGIGIEYNIFRDTIYVVTPLSGGPSEKVGLLIGDKIIKVDDELVAGIGIKSRGVLDRLRGPKGSTVEVSVLRKNQAELLDFQIVRDKIPQTSVDANYMVDEEIGYIKVNRFTAATYNEFLEAMNALKKEGMQKLILDLTGNPGGYMDRAIKMVDEFVAGDSMIVFTKGKEFRYNQDHKAGADGVFETQPLIVLIDEGSASASEIVSGAIQDNDRGLIVGRRSFGKGLVQMPIELNDGSELRLTISRYYTPSGRSIQKDYGADPSAYHSDIYERYNSGEIYDADKVQVNDSLKYATSKGRVVYGGGGIIPDVYVVMDTIGNSTYLNKLFTSNSIREYAMNYTSRNRESLIAMGYKSYYSSFSITEDMMQDLVELAKTNNVKYDEESFAVSKALIETYLKAQIARGIWNNNGFYPLWNQTNEIYNQAIQLFDKADSIYHL